MFEQSSSGQSAQQINFIFSGLEKKQEPEEIEMIDSAEENDLVLQLDDSNSEWEQQDLIKQETKQVVEAEEVAPMSTSTEQPVATPLSIPPTQLLLKTHECQYHVQNRSSDEPVVLQTPIYQTVERPSELLETSDPIESAYDEAASPASSEDIPILQRYKPQSPKEEEDEVQGQPPLKKLKKDLVAQSSFVGKQSISNTTKYLIQDLSQTAINQVQATVVEFRRRTAIWKAQGKKKGDMIAYKEMKQLLENKQFFDDQFGQRFRSYGHIKGVRIGDKFSCRAEIAIVGVHDELMRGIYYSERQPAYAICLSGAYADDEDKGDFFVYTGEGGQKKSVQVEDQVMEKGNLALVLSYDRKVPVRVIRGGYDSKKNLMYFYDGLFIVERYEICESQQQKYVSEARVKQVVLQLQEKNKSQKNKYSENPKIFKFHMRGIPGHCGASQVIQFRNPYQNVRLAQVNISIAGLKFHPYLCDAEFQRRDNKRMEVLKQKQNKGEFKILMEDLSNGLERTKIPVIVPKKYFSENIEIPQITYITNNCNWSLDAQKLFEINAVHSWTGCGILRCGDQYNNGGQLLSTDFCGVFECGKDCNRSVTCKLNQVVSNGLYLPLEVRFFGNKGYGVTCSVDVPSGAFICEYRGEVITDLEADFQLKGKDKYLFSIDHYTNLYHVTEDRPTPEDFSRMPTVSREHRENHDAAHLVIDALNFGNVARFINHSCEPNLGKQVVLTQNASFLYHSICFFALCDIKAGTELCYDYFWKPMQDTTDDDSKVFCCCGAAQCKGRLL